MIAGLYRPRGDGLAIALRQEVPAGERDRLISTPAIGGPFVVVAARTWHGFYPGASAELVVLAAPTVAGSSGTAVLNAGVGRFMHGGLRQVVAGAPTLGSGLPATSTVDVYPWYVFEGESGAIGLWVRRNDPANPCVAVGLCSVWPLVRAGEDLIGRGRKNGAGRLARTAWGERRQPRGGLPVPA